MKALLKRLFPFLRGQRVPLEQDQIERIALIRTGSALHASRALQTLRAHFPAAAIAVVTPRTQYGPFLNNPDVARVIFYDGAPAWRRLRKEVQQGQFDLKAVLFTGEGHVVLKLLAFSLPARRMIAFTEGGGYFRWDFDDRLAIWNHLKWRLGAGDAPTVTLRQNIVTVFLRRLARGLANVLLTLVALLGLLLWHARFLVSRRIHAARLREERDRRRRAARTVK